MIATEVLYADWSAAPLAEPSRVKVFLTPESASLTNCGGGPRPASLPMSRLQYFARGANPERREWLKPRRRTSEDSERCYGVLRRFVQHMKQRPDVRFVTAADLPGLYEDPVARTVDRRIAGDRLRRQILFGDINENTLSAAEMLLALLDVPMQIVDGPTDAGKTTYAKPTIPGQVFRRAASDAAAYIRRFGRLPNEVFVGAETLSLADFAVTLAGSIGKVGDVDVVHGTTAFEPYFATDGKRPFNWVIHPEGFDGSALLELGRLQGWTLKPARLRN